MDKLTFDPAGFGFARADLDELLGGDAQANAAEVRAVFAGATGPVRDAVVLGRVAAGVGESHRHLDGLPLHVLGTREHGSLGRRGEHARAEDALRVHRTAAGMATVELSDRVHRLLCE